jgi:Glycosyltransferase like family
MIAFGCAVTDETTFAGCFEPGYRLAAEADSLLITDRGGGSVSVAYNRILERIAGMESAEALVLAHQDLEILSDDFCARVRSLVADPRVGVVGGAGATGVSSLAWWDPGPVVGAWEWVYNDDGARLSTDSWDAFEGADGVVEVDAVDGMCLVLSPAAIRSLRFDEALDPSAHGYDVDISFQARESGLKVLVAPLGIAHHHGLAVLDDPTEWIETHQRFARKWEGRFAIPPNGRWEERARLAEAQRGAAEVGRNQLSMLRNAADQRANASEERAQAAERDAIDARREAKHARFEAASGHRVYRAAVFAKGLLRRVRPRRADG